MPGVTASTTWDVPAPGQTDGSHARTWSLLTQLGWVQSVFASSTLFLGLSRMDSPSSDKYIIFHSNQVLL